MKIIKYFLLGLLGLIDTLLNYGLIEPYIIDIEPQVTVIPGLSTAWEGKRIAVIAASVGMLLFIIGGASALGLLLAKSIAQPQGVAIYDPARIIRSLDIFVAMANMSGIIAHFVGTIASVGLFIWLHPEL
ncbi:DUF3611 family protein [Scytonema sp. UIC 10036]|nr:DUF3611 family protein [Scytonema sp. UIC 10036]